MKAMNKMLKLVVLSVGVLLVILVMSFYLFSGYLLRVGIETAGTKALGVGVYVDDVDLSILGGTVEIDGLIVKNPPGYAHEDLLKLGHGRVTAKLGSLLGDTVRIKEIKLDGIDLVLEQRGVTSNNLQDIIKAIPEGEVEPEDVTEKPAKKLHIDNLEITNVTVKAKLLPVPGKADTVTLKLDPIQMTNLGSDDKLDVAKLSGKILLAIADGVAEQGVGVLPKEMVKTMKATLSKTAELGKAATEEGKKLLEKSKDTGKGLIEGFKGLLKPKKEE